MDNEEQAVLAMACLGAVVALVQWYQPIAAAWPPGRARSARRWLGLLPAAALFGIWRALGAWGDPEVRDSLAYMAMYAVIGIPFVTWAVLVLSALMDIRPAEDGLFRGNRAVLAPVAGLYLGLAALYAGSNAGEGPGWWCVLATAGLGLAGWGAVAWACAVAGRFAERITVDRDGGAGLRFGLFLLAGGLLAGRAAAGDWVSFAATAADFGRGWPILPLALAAAALERFLARADMAGEGAVPGP